jgi:NitT/TauT family transport system substrate-binding protein
MKPRSRLFFAAAVCIPAIVVTACSSSGSSSNGGGGATAAAAQGVTICGGDSITVTYGQPSVENAPVWIANDQQLFKKYGLNAKMTQVTGPAITQALIGSSTDFIKSTTASTFAANLAGGDVVLIGSFLNVSPYDIVVKSKDIKTVNDLKGKKVALVSQNDGPSVALSAALGDVGLATSDVKPVYGFANDTQKLAAVTHGAADATLVSAEQRPIYEKLGLSEMYSLLDSKTAYIQGGLFTRRAMISQKPKVVSCFLEAMADAVHVYHSDKDAAVKVTAKYERQSEASMEPGWEAFNKAMSDTVTVTEAEVQSSMKLQAPGQHGILDQQPSRFADFSLSQALDSSGFYKSLGGS